jgi:integral membrane protein
MLRLFRYVAFFEGVTTLALFLVAMPLKYWLGDPRLVPPVGAIHGGAWLLYIAAMVLCLPGKGLSAWGWARTFIAALLPFGTFLNDPYLRRIQHARALRLAIS